MRLHRSTTEAVIQSLDLIFGEKRYADKVIEKVLKQNPKWGARDRRFIAETTYDIVRWYLLLKRISESKGDDYWRLLAAWCVLHGVDLPKWSEFEGVDERKIRKLHDESQAVRKVRESIPDWLDEYGVKELGEELWEKEISASNEQATVVLRANTLKLNTKELHEILKEENIRTYPILDFPQALALEERQNVFGSAAFKDGLFEVQDAASQKIAPFMEVQPGHRVIDACAGAGGKTLHLAALMENKGRIIAMDVEQWKLDELQKRARRAGVSNMETRIIESSKTVKRLEGTADRLLLDVPCSGSGVLKRNPDAKWKLSLEFIEKVQELQQHILNDYAEMVKVNGIVVYSTCSIFPSENEKQIKKFLSARSDQFKLLDQRHYMPSFGFDGFYMAKLQRLK